MSEDAITLEELTEILGRVTDHTPEEIREEAESMNIAPPKEGKLIRPKEVAEATGRSEEEVRERWRNAFNIKEESDG